MLSSDKIQLAIVIITGATAVFTFFAGIAAWRSASASRDSVKEQRAAGERAAKDAKQQMEFLAQQINAVSAQAQAAEAHAKTAFQQSQAEVVRWVMEVHSTLDKTTHRMQRRAPVAVAEYFLFRAGLLPRDLFFTCLRQHTDQTFNPGASNKPRNEPIKSDDVFGYRWWKITPGIDDTGVGTDSYSGFLNLWETISKKVAINFPQLNQGSSLTEKGQNDLTQIIKEVLDKLFPAVANVAPL